MKDRKQERKKGGGEEGEKLEGEKKGWVKGGSG